MESGSYAVETVLLQAVPENRHAVEHFAAAVEELLAVEPRIEVRFLQFLHDVAGVLALDSVVPGEERQAQVRDARLLDLQQAVLDFLPESRRRPVLDGEAGALGNHRVLATVDALQLVAEVQRRWPAVPAFAEVLVAQPERLADTQQPLVVSGPVTVETAIDGALDVDQLGIALE